jgi:hypothetical protein
VQILVLRQTGKGEPIREIGLISSSKTSPEQFRGVTGFCALEIIGL